MNHKGEILEKVVRRINPNITDLARKMEYNRVTLYDHFADADLDDGIILKYAKALKYNFTYEFPDLGRQLSVISEPLTDYKPITVAEALSQVDYWKDKYIDLLEKYNEILKR